jgi:HNH endonuclease/NUMOD4 motif
MTERWLPVVGYEGLYEVSDLGRVKSLEKVVVVGKGAKRWYPEQIMKTGSGKSYPVATLHRDGKGTPRKVHTLVLEAFVGPCPPGEEACHWNDIRTDNRLENLRWDTRPANRQDSVRNGKHWLAARTHCKNGHEFTPENTFTKDGHRACRECKSNRDREYRLNNILKYREQKRKYREANREARAEYDRKYREANQERRAENDRAYREANREAISQQKRQYREDNREAINERQRKHYRRNREAINERRRAGRSA